MAEKDPFTQVYDKIVAELQADYKNVVSYNTIRGPKKETLTESDLPEVMLLPDTAMIMLGGASCETTVNMTYQVMTKTGDQRVGYKMFPVMWTLLKTYHRLKYGGILEALTFQEHSFITDVSTGTATLELGGIERNAYGWGCLWPITVHMSIPELDLNAS